ncbi:unnamed protein product [Owenia fusiformis]|uniref:Uncharacterized protein n=1 Tax=Owenia fusiformis TaxID=6347 RepID=A0A8S4PVJ8_OWEFU|nr:unnamed protein product [Owenia fusiformis]
MDDLVKLHNKRKEYFEKFKHLDSLYERNSRYFTTFEKQKWTDCVTNKNSKGLFLKEIFTEREQLLKDLIFGKYRQEVPTVPDRNGMYQHLGNNNSSQVQGHQQPSSMQSLQTMQPSSQPPDTNNTASRSNHHGVQLSNLVNEIVGRCYDPTPQPNDMENRGTSDNTFNQGISSNNLRVNESHIAPPLYHSILSPSATSTSSEPNVVPAKPGNSVKRASTKSPILYSALSKPAPERGEHTDIHSRYTWHRPVTQQSNRTSSPPLAIPQTNTSSPVVQPTNTSTIMSSSPSVPSINTMSSPSLIIPSSNMTSSSSLKVTSSKPSNTFTSSSVVDPPNNTFTSPSSTMDIPSNTFTSLPSVMDSSNNTITSAAVMHPSSKISTSSSLIVPSVNTISSPSLILPQSNTTSPTPLEVSASKTISSSSHMVSPTDVIMSSSSTPVPFVSLSEFTQSPTHIAGGKRGLDDGLGIEDILEGSPSKKSTIEFFNPKITSTERMVSVEFDIPFADTPQNHDLNFDASLSTPADVDNCDNNIIHENTQHDCSQFRNTGSSREYVPDELMTDGTSIEGNSNDTMLFDQQTKLVKQEIDDTKDADSPCPMRSNLFDVNNVHVSNNMTVDQTSPCSDEQDKDSFCSLEKQCPVSPCPTLAYGEDEQVSDNEDDSNSIRESISRRCLDDSLDSEDDLQRNATKESGALDVNQSETNGPGPKINMSEIMDDLIGYVSDDSDTEKSLTDAEESPIDAEESPIDAEESPIDSKESPINEEDSRQYVMKMCDSNKDGEQSDDSKIDNDMMAIRMNSDETGAIPDEETAEIHKEEITEDPAQESSETIDKESPENRVQESTENPDKESSRENTHKESSKNAEDTTEDDDCLFIKDIIFIETLSKSPELIELSDDEMDKDDKVTTTQEFEYDDNKEDAENNADDDDILRTADRVEAAITADIEDPEKDSAEKDSQCDSEQDDQITTTTSSPRQPSSSCDNRTPSSSRDGGTSSSEHQKPCSQPIQYNMKLYLVKDKDTDKERTISSEDYSKDIHTFLLKARLATVRTKLTSKHSNIPTVERDGKPFTLSKCLKKLFNKCDDERLSAALKRYTHTHRPHRNERRLFQTLLDDTVKDEHLGLLVSLRDFCKNITNIDKFINTVYGGVTLVRDVLIPYVYRDKTQYVPQNAIHVELFSSDENKMGYHNFCCVLKSVGLKSVVATPAEQAYFKPNLTTGPFSKLIKLKDFTNLALPKLLQKSDK